MVHLLIDHTRNSTTLWQQITLSVQHFRQWAFTDCINRTGFCRSYYQLTYRFCMSASIKAHIYLLLIYLWCIFICLDLASGCSFHTYKIACIRYMLGWCPYALVWMQILETESRRNHYIEGQRHISVDTNTHLCASSNGLTGPRYRDKFNQNRSQITSLFIIRITFCVWRRLTACPVSPVSCYACSLKMIFQPICVNSNNRLGSPLSNV